MDSLVTFADVQRAADRIRPYLHRTPLLTSATLNEELGLQAFFKAENLQKVGAFKARGALNAVLNLDAGTAQRGVVTHSSGNHGAALAFAAAVRKIPCTVVMPDNAPRVKQDAVAGYGAAIELCGQYERDETAARVCAETGGVLIHPFEDPHVIAGQGTATLELLEDAPALDAVITPIGGGGLLSGSTIAAAAVSPQTRVMGAEPELVDDAYRSLISGRRQPRVPNAGTLADGLLTGIGANPFSILSRHDVEVVLVSEAEIVAAARFHLERMKTVVEPSGATGLAALLRVADRFRGGRVGVVISGGNTDFAWLER
jgi:threonine dehydratase